MISRCLPRKSAYALSGCGVINKTKTKRKMKKLIVFGFAAVAAVAANAASFVWAVNNIPLVDGNSSVGMTAYLIDASKISRSEMITALTGGDFSNMKNDNYLLTVATVAQSAAAATNINFFIFVFLFVSGRNSVCPSGLAIHVDQAFQFILRKRYPDRLYSVFPSLLSLHSLFLRFCIGNLGLPRRPSGT